MMTTYDRLKRVLDVTVGVFALLVTAPLQLAIAVAVRRSLGRPVFFRQARPGKDEVLFELVKFRTMRDPEPATGLGTDEQRMTALGSRLRSTSLDELPTLWNVVKGDLSLVGPRPLLTSYLPRYSPAERRRHEVRPGLTGLAQIEGRNSVSWEARLAKDVEYVERRSLRLDLEILVRTLPMVVRRRGITDEAGVTMAEFRPPEPGDQQLASGRDVDG